MVYELDSAVPLFALGRTPFIAPEAAVIGQVSIGKGSSIWFSAVVRADDEAINIGDNTNIQDCAVLHSDKGFPLDVGANCTIGHSATIHGCTIGDGCLIGIGAVILNGARIGRNSIIGANTLITENKIIPEGSVVMGTPGKVVGQTSAKQAEDVASNARAYMAKAERYWQHLARSETTKEA